MFCRHCGKGLENDSKFCPYCGKEVAIISYKENATGTTPLPEQKIQPESAPENGRMKAGGKKKVTLGLGIILGLTVLGVGISALAGNAKENKEPEYVKFWATQAVHATNTPTPVQESFWNYEEKSVTSSVNDVELRLSTDYMEVGEVPDAVYVEVIRNGYEGSVRLRYEVEDESVANCQWGASEIEDEYPLLIVRSKDGETKVKVYIQDSDVSAEFYVVCGENASGDTSEPVATSTPKPTKKPKATATPKPSAGTYTKTSVLTGKKISANAGTGTVVYMEEGRADELILVPDFAAWNEGKFTGSSESRTTYMSFQRRAGKTPGLDVAEAYIELLKDKYGFSVKQTADQDPDWIGEFKYVWECTKNGLTMEVSLFGLTEMPEYFTFKCTKDFLFIDLGNRLSGNSERVDVSGMNAQGTPTTYAVTTICDVINEFPTVRTSDWTDNHYIGFVLSTDYEKGKVLNYSEFEKYNVLTAYKCYGEFRYASGDAGYVSTHEQFADQIEDMKVEILDIKNGYPAVYFYAQIVDDAYTRYYIEGICAPGEDDILPTTSSDSGSAGGGSSDSGYTGSVPSYGGTKDCIYCENGYVDCMTCNGKGSYTCKVCKGVGSVSHYGYTSDCDCTNGIQYCTNPYCNGGKKRCNICGGRGYQ